VPRYALLRAGDAARSVNGNVLGKLEAVAKNRHFEQRFLGEGRGAAGNPWNEARRVEVGYMFAMKMQARAEGTFCFPSTITRIRRHEAGADNEQTTE